MQRISVIGSSGAGKSTVARRIGDLLDLPYLELDSVFHQAGWRPLPDKEFRARVDTFTSGSGWVVDGNYTSHGVADIVWPRADTIVWLDLPKSTVMKRVIARTVRRAVKQEELWNGNREPWNNFFDPRPEKNIIVWAWTRHGGVREKYQECLDEGSWSHAEIHRLHNQTEIGAFLDQIDRGRS